ncbi:MAG: hypothetical protein QM790_19465 [Nibricoccus sp.]
MKKPVKSDETKSAPTQNVPVNYEYLRIEGEISVTLDRLCAISPKAQALRNKLAEVQYRLGTPGERTNDEMYAIELAHDLNNMLAGFGSCEPPVVPQLKKHLRAPNAMLE